MGFSLTSFAGGFAKGLHEDIKEEEKLAEARAVAGVKNMYESYQTMQESNRKLKGELVNNINTLRQYDDAATEDQLFEIAKSKPLMDLITAKIKSGDYEANKIRLSNFAAVKETNSTATALQRADELFEIPKLIKGKVEEEKKRTGNFLRDVISGAGDTAGETAALRAAEMLGVSLDTLKAAAGRKSPTLASSASINMEAFQKKKQPNDVLNDIKIEAWTALKAGDKVAYEDATKRLKEAESVFSVDKNLNDMLGRAQVQLQNTKDPAEAAMLRERVSNLEAEVKRSAEATRVKSPEERKPPSLGTLEASTRNQIKLVMEAKYGNRINNGIAFVPVKINGIDTGDFDVRITATDPAFRKEMYGAMQEIAKSHLAGYDQNDIGVRTVINKYNPKNFEMSDSAPADSTSTKSPTPVVKPQEVESVTVGDKKYTRPANFTDDQWNKYKQQMGAK